MDWTSDINNWLWLAIGLALIAIEMVLPTQILLWIGLAALATGLITSLFIDMAWSYQLCLFALCTFASIAISQIWMRAHPVSHAKPYLNQRGHHYIGRLYTLTEPIVDGVGRVRFDDSSWRVSGPDLPAGTRIKVVDCDGLTLIVSPMPR